MFLLVVQSDLGAQLAVKGVLILAKIKSRLNDSGTSSIHSLTTR